MMESLVEKLSRSLLPIDQLKQELDAVLPKEKVITVLEIITVSYDRKLYCLSTLFLIIDELMLR